MKAAGKVTASIPPAVKKTVKVYKTITIPTPFKTGPDGEYVDFNEAKPFLFPTDDLAPHTYRQSEERKEAAGWRVSLGTSTVATSVPVSELPVFLASAKKDAVARQYSPPNFLRQVKPGAPSRTVKPEKVEYTTYHKVFSHEEIVMACDRRCPFFASADDGYITFCTLGWARRVADHTIGPSASCPAHADGARPRRMSRRTTAAGKSVQVVRR